MSSEPSDGEIDEASRELAKAIWNVGLVARDGYQARGLLGQAHRRTLVEKIRDLIRLLRSHRQND